MRVGVRAVIESISTEAEGRDTAISFDEAFTLHHRAVFVTARALLRDAAQAEEVTQDVFLKLYRHQDSAPGGELLRPWLLRVAINESRNAIRSRTFSTGTDMRGHLRRLLGSQLAVKPCLESSFVNAVLHGFTPILP